MREMCLRDAQDGDEDGGVVCCSCVDGQVVGGGRGRR